MDIEPRPGNAAAEGATAVATPASELVAPTLQHEIEQFLYREAMLLDERRYAEWYALLADDLRYRMPTRYNRLRREADREFSAPNEAALFDDDKHSIGQRIKRLSTGMAWAEDPPSRTRHMVSNVQVHPTANADEFMVDCYYLLYRSRLEREVEIFVGMRHDLLRRVGTASCWQIAKRTIILDQTVVLARNLSFFF
jgi:biphenyl 2,3-dioxygenase beta subunit